MALVLPALATVMVLTIGYFGWLIFRPERRKPRLLESSAKTQPRRRKP